MKIRQQPPARRAGAIWTRVALGGAMLVALAGCTGGGPYRAFWNESGSGSADDSYTYVSTTHQPKTVSVVDTRTGEVLWSVDVPVGQQLSMKFYHEREKDNPYAPDLLKWSLWDAGTKHGRLDNAMLVPSGNARRVDMTLRTSPEFPQ